MANIINYSFMLMLVENGTNLVRFDSLHETHRFLLENGLRFVDKEPRNQWFSLILC